MKLLATVSELNAANAETAKAIEALGLMEVRANTAEAALKEASASLAAITAERDAAKAALEEQAAQAVAAKSAMLALEGELATIKATTGSVAVIAAATVSAMGHEQITVKSGTQNAVSIREQYEAMKPGPERRAFREKHLAKLSASLN